MNSHNYLKKSLHAVIRLGNLLENRICNAGMSPKPILRRLMIILSVMVLVLIVSAGVVIGEQHSRYLEDIIVNQLNEVSDDFQGTLDQQASGLAMALQPIVSDKAVKEALREGDSERLLRDWERVFETMKKENHLTHFYFLDKNRVCLLRVHNPAKHGDLINRFTALKAEWTHKASSGIEIGPLGTFTLRVIQPVFEGDRLIGYVELGKEIEDVLQNLHIQSGNEIAVVIRKEYLKRQTWEEGMRMLGRKADWNQLPNDAVIYTSKERLTNVLSLMEHHHDVERLSHQDINHEVVEDSKKWRVSIIPVRDVSDKEIGDMIIMKDIAHEKSELLDFIAVNALSGVILIGVVLGFIFLVLRRTDKNIRHQQANLLEAEERFEQLAEQSRTFVWEVDAQGMYTYVSNAVEQVLGYRSDELVGQKYFYELYPQEGREAFRKNIFEIFERHESYEKIQNLAVTHDGRTVWLSSNAIAMVSHEGLLLGYRGSDTDISEHKLSEEKINLLAFFDQLTGLPNRILLLDRLKQALMGSSRSGNYGALLFIDLDNFKTLNDTLGHDMGDKLLKQAARRISLCVREGDTVSRFGGDEFVVVLSGLSSNETDAATASEGVAEKILAALNQPYLLGEIQHRSSASIGVTLYKSDDTSIDDLMKQADLAMYKSKEAGRNGLSFFDPNMESALRERAGLEEDLRRGIEEKQFILYYQSQVDTHGLISGVEALVRWMHPQRGMVSPAEFIPVAEETALILPLGDWILNTACEQLASWSHFPEMEKMSIAVNVSAKQFSQSNFVSQVLLALKQSGANAKRLKLELTESILVQNVEDVIEKMAALKNAGVGFSLDDFGTGYSSLSYLKRLPLDQLKIDQSFVRDLLVDPNDAIICKSTIALAESMGLSVIAEGVETLQQRNALSEIGCNAYQGYWFSRPLPLAEFEALYKITMTKEKA